MLNHLVCGTFHREEEDEERLKSSDSSPRKSKRNKSHSKASKNDNPYSTRGLDKFSALLADLNEKRQKIYSQTSPQDISFVRFVYTSSDDFVPVVVKVKNKDQRKHKSEELRRVPCNAELMDNNNNNNKPAIESSLVSMEESRKQHNSESDQKKAEKKKFSWIMWRRPCYYLPVVMILILVFLTMVGRSAATLCTCIVWYIVPKLKDTSKPRRSMKKKDYERGLSEKKMVSDHGGLGSPRSSANSGASKDKPPRKHGHQKSW